MNIGTKRIYILSHTPCHGYLKIPKKDIEALKIVEFINYFYDRGDMIEIEEDEDAPEFLRLARAAGWPFEIIHRDVNNDSAYPWPPPELV